MSDKVTEYIRNGGKIFYISHIETYRDGGTKIIHFINSGGIKPIYVDKNTNQFHHDFPTTKENVISDELLIAYLIDRLTAYVNRLQHEIVSSEKLLTILNEKYIVK